MEAIKIKTNLDTQTNLTQKQIEELENAARYPIIFDEDCPELTENQLKKFRPVNGRKIMDVPLVKVIYEQIVNKLCENGYSLSTARDIVIDSNILHEIAVLVDDDVTDLPHFVTASKNAKSKQYA